MQKRLSIKIVSLILGVAIICFLVVFYVAAVWEEPISSLLTDNIPTPINKSNQAQTKIGILSASTFYDTEAPQFYIDPNGQSFIQGEVGIGISPDIGIGNLKVGGALDVVGSGDDYFKLPSLTTAERDALVVQEGFLIYNSTDDIIQGYIGGQWRNFGGTPDP